MATAGPESKTPILDLISPLPVPLAERISRRSVLLFLIVIATISLTRNFDFLLVPFGFLFMVFLLAATHELGHLIAGWCVGLRFQGVDIGPLSFKRLRDGLRFKLRPLIYRGQAFMSLNRIHRIRRRLIIFIAGGAVASFLSGAVTLVAAEIIRTRYNSPWITFSEFFGVFSLFIGFLSFLPYRSYRHANDGMLLRALLCSRKDGAQMIASYAIAAIKDKDVFLQDYYRRWWRLATAVTPVQNKQYYSDWVAYEAAQDTQGAAECLERCLAGSSFLDDEQRDHLVAEVATFTAWRRDDAKKAEAWRKRVVSLEELDSLTRIRIEVALSCARKQFHEATEKCEEGIVLLRQRPAGAQARITELSWIDWKRQIEERRMTVCC